MNCPFCGHLNDKVIDSSLCLQLLLQIAVWKDYEIDGQPGCKNLVNRLIKLCDDAFTLLRPYAAPHDRGRINTQSNVIQTHLTYLV